MSGILLLSIMNLIGYNYYYTKSVFGLKLANAVSTTEVTVSKAPLPSLAKQHSLVLFMLCKFDLSTSMFSHSCSTMMTWILAGSFWLCIEASELL